MKYYIIYDEMGDIFETTEQNEMLAWFDNHPNVSVMYRTEMR